MRGISGWCGRHVDREDSLGKREGSVNQINLIFENVVLLDFCITVLQ